MSWRLGLGVAVVVGVSIAAVVVSIATVGNPRGVQRIRDAIRWPSNCQGVVVDRPANVRIMARWSPLAGRTANVVCQGAGASVAYAQFTNQDALNRALARYPPSERYCLVGTAIVIDRLAQFDPTVFTDMCRSLSGTFVNASHG